MKEEVVNLGKGRREVAVAPVEQAKESEVVEEAPSFDLHIRMTTEGADRVKKCAEYAAIEGIIETNPRGNISNYTNFCLQIGENYLRQYDLKKRGFQ